MNTIDELKNKIFLCEVQSVQNYGAFVQLPGCKTQGLIHRTQISKTEVDDASDVLKKGDRVWCKVVNINDEGKIGMSMKVVDQGNGQDMDPNGVTVFQDEQKRKSRPPKDGKRAIVLEAVLKTTCTQCKTPGHLAKDCFQSLDGKTYELLPDEDDEPLISPEVQVEEKTKSKKLKKHKKDKKHKKEKKKRKHSSSESSSEDNHHKKKKKKKHKK